MTRVFPPCLAQQLGVLWPLRCWWLSPRRGQGAVFWEGGNRKQHPSPVAGWETNNWVKLRRRSVWVGLNENKEAEMSFPFITPYGVYKTILWPSSLVRIFLGTRVCQVAVLSPVSIQTFMPACSACWGGPLCLCAFWGWQKPSKHPMMVDDFVLKDFKYFSFSIYKLARYAT